jgi:peptidoglycan/xylan/chitin deacetylase (PgdA/CDA1 family)
MILNGHTISGESNNLMQTLCPLFSSATNLAEDRAANSIRHVTWTFDDCHMDLLEIDQILRLRFGITFRFFVSPLLIDRYSSGSIEFVRDQLRDPTATLLNWDEIGALLENGHVLGLHGYDHSDFNVMSRPQIIDQHEQSIELLHRRLGVYSDSFAFPFGRVSDSDDVLKSNQIMLTKRYFDRIYLSDNRLPLFRSDNVFNRRHAEFGDSFVVSFIKGLLQYRFSARLKRSV